MLVMNLPSDTKLVLLAFTVEDHELLYDVLHNALTATSCADRIAAIKMLEEVVERAEARGEAFQGDAVIELA
jgi:hypothetical protein